MRDEQGGWSPAVAARIEGGLARLIARLPAGVVARMSGEPPVEVDGGRLDPHVQLARAVRRRRGGPGLCEPTVEAGRERYRRETRVFGGVPTVVGAVRDFSIPGSDGAGMLRVRHYAPPPGAAPREGGALLVYLHGGGFVLGDLDTHDEPCRMLCRHAETHVLSVAYRLAPEHPFPAAVEDAVAALGWARENAASLGAVASRVGVGGDSAGANLATVAARYVRATAQLLIYPATDPDTPRPSRERFGAGYFLDRRDHDDFLHHYAGSAAGRTADDRRAPMAYRELGALPPALVVTAGFDMLRDEGEAYAERLGKAGVPVETIRFASLVHGFIHMTAISPGARGAMIELARRWRAFTGREGGAS